MHVKGFAKNPVLLCNEQTSVHNLLATRHDRYISCVLWPRTGFSESSALSPLVAPPSVSFTVLLVEQTREC